MNTIYLDPPHTDDQRRDELYQGQLFVYSPNTVSNQFCDFADKLIRDAFGEADPEMAQWQMPVDLYVNVLRKLKPAFIHHPESKRFIQDMLRAQGCDLEKTYFDVPRLRSSTSNNYLTSGIAYAFHPHRDTWYSAPMSQINWWMPVYGISQKNCLAIHPQYWDTPIKNDSNLFNYKAWNEDSRKNSAQHVNEDTRWQPKPQEPIELDPQLRIITNPGGVILFSAAHLHSSVPNTSGKTRFSIDFRTIHIDDIRSKKGAPNIDTAAQDLTLGDYLCAADFSHLPPDLIQQDVVARVSPVEL